MLGRDAAAVTPRFISSYDRVTIQALRYYVAWQPVSICIVRALRADLDYKFTVAPD